MEAATPMAMEMEAAVKVHQTPTVLKLNEKNQPNQVPRVQPSKVLSNELMAMETEMETETVTEMAQEMAEVHNKKRKH